MSEFTGNRRELSAWLEELDEIKDRMVHLTPATGTTLGPLKTK